MSETILDVLVIGAGPVGLVLANELARFNVNFRIVEKIETRSTWSKALMITSRTMNILENIGLNEEILSEGTIVEGGDMHWNQSRIGSVTLPSNTQGIRYPFPFVLPQPDVEAAFEHVLNDRGTKVERDSEVVKLQVLNEYVEVTIKGGETIRAKYVVGCDGAHSLVRHSQEDWKFEGRPVNVLWAQCDGTLADQRIHTTRAAFFIGSTGFSLRLPLYHHQRRFRVIVTVPPEVENLESTGEFKYGRVAGKAPTLEQFNSLIKASTGPYFAEVTDPTWLTYFMVQERMVSHLRSAKRLFLAGDAAHCHSPAGGQGMNMGIQDAHNLAWKLALVVKGQTNDPDKLLDSYTAERIPIIKKTIGMTANMMTGATAAGSWYSPLIRLFLSTVTRFKSVQSRLIPTLLQSSLCLTPTPDGILSTHNTVMVKSGTMLPDPPHPVFELTASPPNLAGTTHLMSLIRSSYKHIALFIIADHTLHEPHPLFHQFSALCKLYSDSVRPVILARSVRIGGLRKPNWANEDILFLATNTSETEKTYGLDGKHQMGMVIVRPDGYIAYSSLVDRNGDAFEVAGKWLAGNLVKS